MRNEKENKTPGIDLNTKVDLNTKIEELLGIDLRSIGLFRVTLGVIIVIDLLVRATALGAHYTDAGVAPRMFVAEYGEQPWFLSFHMLSGGPGLQIVLFILTGLSALALIVGYKSRLACFLCWILMLSLHVRNPFVNNLGDWLLVDLLFWGMFLPLGARFAVDAGLRPANQVLPVRVLSIATLAVLLQICFVYFFSVERKFSPVWHTDGTAIQFALNLDMIVSALGRLLLNLPEKWLHFMTFATLYLERWGPVLVFFPFFVGPVRTTVAFTFIGFHLILAIVFALGIFPFVCIAAWFLVFPSWFWDKFEVFFSRLPLVFAGLAARLTSFWDKQKPREIKLLPGVTETLIAVLGLIFMVLSALMYGGIMDEVFYERYFKYVEPVGNTLNMKQRWDMFSPQPPRRDGWFVIAGYLEGGEVINLFEPEKGVYWSRPENIVQTYKNQRWLKYLEWVMNKQAPFAGYLGAYFKTTYAANSPTSDKLQRVKVYLMQETTLLDLNTSAVMRVTLSEQ